MVIKELLNLEVNGQATIIQVMIYTTKDGVYDTNLHLMAAQNPSYPSVPGITIDSYNKVGIGITLPAALLDIQAPVGHQKLLRLGSERPGFFNQFVLIRDPAYSHLGLSITPR